MLSEANPATESGRIVGEMLVWVALLGGALKCWSTSRRPATNTKCALSLMIMLLALVFASGAGALIRKSGLSPELILVGGVLRLGMMAALVTAIVLAILGLVECSKRRDVYTQGRTQAIWALALAGVMCLIAGVGFVRGLQRAAGFGTAAGQSQPGKILAFEDLNFQFRSPDRPWVAFDASRVNKDSKLSFMRRNPEAYFIIIAEKFGTQMGFTAEQLAEVGKAHLQAAAVSSRVVSQVPQRVKGLDGLLVETETQVGSYQLHYRHWYCVTNGYAYQLIGYSRSEDQQGMARDLEDMLSHFELIDPNRMASVSGSFTTNFYSPRHNYAVILTNSAWHPFSSLEKSLPMAEFGVSQGDSCMVVTPARINGEKISNEALIAAFLATMNFAYPTENLTNEKMIKEGNLQGKQFDSSRDADGLNFHYRFKILQGDGEGYMVCAWTQRRARDAESVFSDALGRVRFLPSPNSFPLLATGGQDGKRETETQGYILNQAGL